MDPARLQLDGCLEKGLFRDVPVIAPDPRVQELRDLPALPVDEPYPRVDRLAAVVAIREAFEVALDLPHVQRRLLLEAVGHVVEVVGDRLLFRDGEQFVLTVLQETPAAVGGLLVQVAIADETNGQHGDDDQRQDEIQRALADAVQVKDRRGHVCHPPFNPHRSSCCWRIKITEARTAMDRSAPVAWGSASHFRIGIRF